LSGVKEGWCNVYLMIDGTLSERKKERKEKDNYDVATGVNYGVTSF
jgi:hypothetical protein